MSGHIATAARTDWCTPPEIVSVVREALGGEIWLDPCSNASSVVNARYTADGTALERDGLELAWSSFQTVYVNPPFGRALPLWVRKAVKESDEAPRLRIVMLLPSAGTDTKIWQKHIFPHARAICFIRGRIKFLGATQGAPMACALVLFGPKSAVPAFRKATKAIGTVRVQTGKEMW